MKRLVSMAAVGLSTVLLLPLAVAAQEAVALREVPDPAGDVQGTAGPMQGEGPTVTVPGPDYLDITELRLEEVGSDLVVTFELAGSIVAKDPAVDEDPLHACSCDRMPRQSSRSRRDGAPVGGSSRWRPA